MQSDDSKRAIADENPSGRVQGQGVFGASALMRGGAMRFRGPDSFPNWTSGVRDRARSAGAVAAVESLSLIKTDGDKAR